MHRGDSQREGATGCGGGFSDWSSNMFWLDMSVGGGKGAARRRGEGLSSYWELWTRSSRKLQ